MNESLYWLIGIILILILVPVVGMVARSIDYKRQISGKRPERRLREDERISCEKSPKQDPEIDRIKEETRIRSFWNLVGPK